MNTHVYEQRMNIYLTSSTGVVGFAAMSDIYANRKLQKIAFTSTMRLTMALTIDSVDIGVANDVRQMSNGDFNAIITDEE
ncbi:hypothetical protein T4B_8003 [Trichinella pseudospiralis]|uniref:Uncharacterized protein n=1 Tax=Trichinella pseudospiralis TaxID=6337 RepID=A0A0V1H024_TRIPS|nr:hypothetical protein T4B_8003 [Trichinella pseudospiralis]